MLLVSASREHLKREVWNKAKPVIGADASLWRKDAKGFVIAYRDHGNAHSPYGWVMHHVLPKSKGGTEALFNLQPVNNSRLKENQDPHPWSRRR